MAKWERWHCWNDIKAGKIAFLERLNWKASIKGKLECIIEKR